jgi:HK97 family phage prohead protease
MTQFKTFPFKIDRVENTGEFCGYAATFGNVDLGGDVIDRGAFTNTLKSNQGRVPILDHHDPKKHIGWNLEAREDKHGLFVCGQLNLEVQLARERLGLMNQASRVGGRMGLSIGFRSIRESPDSQRPEIRHLQELQLIEYSLVIFPMNTEAGVTRIKLGFDDDPAASRCSIPSGEADGLSVANETLIVNTLTQMIHEMQTSN